MKEYIKDNLKLYNGDCLVGMAKYPDNYFDLAIVDPPYGIKKSGQRLEKYEGTKSKHNKKYFKDKGWDENPPNKEYFKELERVSKNQIIWGANHFIENIYNKNSSCWVVWDKGQKLDQADGEMALTSFDKPMRIFEANRWYIAEKGKSIHPTQKPIKLYSWLLQNYSSPEHKILDTHLGSASHAIAWHYIQKKGEFVGFEIDEEYFIESIDRIEQETLQLSLL